MENPFPLKINLCYFSEEELMGQEGKKRWNGQKKVLKHVTYKHTGLDFLKAGISLQVISTDERGLKCACRM